MMCITYDHANGDSSAFAYPREESTIFLQVCYGAMFCVLDMLFVTSRGDTDKMLTNSSAKIIEDSVPWLSAN